MQDSSQENQVHQMIFWIKLNRYNIPLTRFRNKAFMMLHENEKLIDFKKK